jgi:site-specific DNA recombinase
VNAGALWPDRRPKNGCADQNKADRHKGSVLNGLRDILLDNEHLIEEFAAEFKRESARLRKEGHGARRRLLEEQDVERGIGRCLDFVTGGDGDPGSVRDQLRRLEARKRDIDADRMTRQDRDGIVIHPNLPELYAKKVANLQQALQHEATRPQVVETVRSLVDRIEVMPGRDRGHCEVTIVGALAQILAFGQKTTAASTGGGGT